MSEKRTLSGEFWFYMRFIWFEWFVNTAAAAAAATRKTGSSLNLQIFPRN